MNIRQEMFVREYLVDLCGAAAARRAGYSPKGAKSRASRLLRDPEIKEAVEAAMEERVRRIEIKQDEVIRELKTVAMAAASDENGAAVKLGSKLRALELLGKHMGLFEGKDSSETENENNLLEAIIQATCQEVDTHDVSELQ